MRQEAKADADAEPTLASFLYSSILGHATFEKSLNFILANKLASPTLYSTQLVKIIEDCHVADPGIVDAALADMQAVFDRDPACEKYTQCLLYFKGFQAIQCHRIAHHLWDKGRKVRGRCLAEAHRCAAGTAHPHVVVSAAVARACHPTATARQPTAKMAGVKVAVAEGGGE
jgi:hypothetical protein